MHEIILGYQGEMSLKGLNRNQFESAMMKILRYRLKTVGKFKVYCTQSTFYMEPEEEDVDMDLAFDRVSKVFGLASLSRAVVCDKDFDTICQTAEEYLGASLHGIRTFKVEARRSDKSYPMTSPELMRELGAYLLGKHNYLKVDVHNPQFKVIVEIRDYGAYIHGPKVPGEGGLPVGTSGRALAASTARWQLTAWQSAVWPWTTFILRPLRILRSAQNSKLRLWPSSPASIPAVPTCLWCPTPNRRNTSGITPPMCCSRCSCAAA